MSSHSLQPEDALLRLTPKPAVLVQVDELSVTSPTAEATEVLSRIVEVAKTNSEDDDLDFSVPVTRSRTNEMERGAQSDVPTASVQRSSSHDTLWGQKRDTGLDVSPRKRGLGMQLPSFQSLGIASPESGGYFATRPPTSPRYAERFTRPPPTTGRAAAHSLPLPDSETPHPHRSNFGSTPLLTPPEDADSIKWNNALLHHSQHPNGDEPSGNSRSVPQVMASTSQQQQLQGPLAFSQATGESSGESPHTSDDNADDSAFSGSGESSLTNAIQPLISGVAGPEALAENIHVIAQVLPQPAIDTTRSKPAFEEVVEAIQAKQSSDDVAYITITHAVPPQFEMKDLPTSPPATPNLAQGRDDYFGQTVFINAATVSAYHGHKSLLNHQAPSSPNTIVAPSSVQLCVLERYIPPTSAQEYGDFFDSRSHSILVDRLAELSVRGGRLLLLYPTKTGAETFMSSYLGPVLDPFLREFIFLNNLYFALGTTLGQMSAVSSMLEMEGMENRVRGLCRAISRKASLRGGPASTFTLIYSGRGGASIDGQTWKEWFVQQELLRIKENLVDYHKNGGRMPPEVNHREITTGVLARQVIDGISDSSRISGGVPIELGMFVIERTRS